MKTLTSCLILLSISCHTYSAGLTTNVNSAALLDSDSDGVFDNDDAFPYDPDLSSPITETHCSNNSDLVCMHVVETHNTYVATLHNEEVFPITVDFSYSASNLTVNEALTDTFTMASGETSTVLDSYVTVASQGWRISWNYYHLPGDFTTTHDDSHMYSLPFEPGTSYQVSQGFNGDFSHTYEDSLYAVDFVMEEGTPIHAARSGVVIETVDHFSARGLTSYFFDKANYITIEHEDGTHGVYAHLQKDGVLVEVGENVEAQQLIGLSGDTGYSYGPHLHFVVTSPTSAREVTSHRIMFESAEGTITEPVEGMFYTALTNETNNNSDTTESSNIAITDSYDADTGVLYMPVVQVGSDHFEVEMIHLGDLIFQVTMAEFATQTSETPDIYDEDSGQVIMPSVTVGDIHYEVVMEHLGDLVFKVISAN